MKITVIGDVMLDLYPQVERVKISPEAPVIDSVIHQPINLWSAKRGGAGNVAENFAALGENVTLIGVIGKDYFGDILLNLENNVHDSLIVSPDLITTTKIRLLKDSGHIHRISYEVKPEAALWEHLSEEIVKSIPPDSDIFVLVDYDKGLFSFDFCQAIIAALGQNFYIMPKPQNLARFHSALGVAMNSKEYQESKICLSVGLISAPINRGVDEYKGQNIKDFAAFSWKYVLVTEGAKGLTVYDLERNVGQYIPAHIVDVADTCGAGDSASATFFWALAQGYSPYISGHIANYAGALAVQQIGCYHVSLEELSTHFPFLTGEQK